MASTIAVLQDDLRDGLNEMTATAVLVSIPYSCQRAGKADENCFVHPFLPVGILRQRDDRHG